MTVPFVTAKSAAVGVAASLSVTVNVSVLFAILTLLVAADAVAVNAVVPTLAAAVLCVLFEIAFNVLPSASWTVDPGATLKIIVEPSATLAAAVASTL